MSRYRVTKTVTAEQGWSCAFRQWRADSHCRYLHGYALGCDLVFEGNTLNECNWLIDFGGLGSLRAQLADMFDHCTVIAEDDPSRALFESLHAAGACNLIIMPAVGCEMFATFILHVTENWLESQGLSDRVRIAEVRVFEHGSNSATVRA